MNNLPFRGAAPSYSNPDGDAEQAFGESVPPGFDPLNDLLVAQRDRPAHLENINLRALTPFQRALMVIDGTVTKFIEAYTMEPVQVTRLAQEIRHLTTHHPWLEAPEGTPVVARQVLLQGRYSRTFYAYAVSLLVFDRLPEKVIDDLEINPGGLGRVMLAHQLETRREVLWYGRECLNELPEPIRHTTDGKFISRTYRIIAREKPLMLINEKFPVRVGQALVHH